MVRKMTNQEAATAEFDKALGEIRVRLAEIADGINEMQSKTPFPNWANVNDTAGLASALTKLADRLLQRGEHAPETI